ncbi:MAG: tyrosinase family protein [Vicinamibacterales bacterium]
MTTVRQRVDCLTERQQEQLREAFRRLMQSSDPNANYAFWAGIHGRCCPHRSELFLPWHRAYIYQFERALQQAVGDPDLGLPYWNWTTTRDVPELFTKEPLTADRDPKRDPAKLPTPDIVEGLLNLPAFGDFGGRRCRPKCSGGDLEDVHAGIHGWLGRTMGDPKTAACDPIFWIHHCYVDALWVAWQQTHSENPRCPGAPLLGIPGDWTVNDTLDTRSPRMDYEVVVCARTFALDNWDTRGVSPSVVMRMPPYTSHLRVTLDVAAQGHGATPIAVEVYGTGDVQVSGSISLFGLHAGGHGGETHAALPVSECGHVSGSPARSFRVTGGDASAFRDLSVQLQFQWHGDAKTRVTLRAPRVEMVAVDRPFSQGLTRP